MRQKIDLATKTLDLISIMGEGNPGAMNVLMNIIQRGPVGMMNILNLDDMNIRGTEIWLGYKDVCKENLDLFIEKITKRDQDMVHYINNYPGTREKAVTHGASFK